MPDGVPRRSDQDAVLTTCAARARGAIPCFKRRHDATRGRCAQQPCADEPVSRKRQDTERAACSTKIAKAAEETLAPIKVGLGYAAKVMLTVAADVTPYLADSRNTTSTCSEDDEIALAFL